MATVRQLTTRFKFETDKKGLSEFREGILGAKTAIAGLAGALGLGTIGGALIKVGSDLNRAAILAQQFTEDVRRLDSGAIELTGELADAWERVQAAIPGRETMREFLDAFVTFRQTFKDAPLEQFETLFEAAGLIARITGTPLADTFDALHQAVVQGDFDALVKFLPEFDQLDANMQSFVRGLIEVDPTRVQTVQQRLQFITEILDKANPQLAKTAELMVETTAEGQWDNLINNIRVTAELLSGPFNNAITKLLAPVNDFFDAWIDGGFTLRSFIDAFKFAFDVEIPNAVIRSLVGIRAFFRDPLGLFDNLALGLQSTFQPLSPEQLRDQMKRIQSGEFFGQRELTTREVPGAVGPFLGPGFGPGMVFAPQITVTPEGGPDLARKIGAFVEQLWDQARDQFRNQEER